MANLPEGYDRVALEEELRDLQQKIDNLKTQIYFTPQTSAPVSVEVGTLAYSDGTNTGNTFGNSAEGFYYYSSATNWVPVAIGGTNSTISLPDSTQANPSIALGNSQDFKIYHEEDSGTGRSFIRESGNGSLVLIGTDFQVRTGDADGNKYRITTDDGNTGGVKLHFGNAGFSDAIKFETAAEGCSVTGAIKITPQSAAPSSPSAGMIYYDSDDNKLKLHNGTSFVDLN